jgi:DnaK suppressor protein
MIAVFNADLTPQPKRPILNPMTQEKIAGYKIKLEKERRLVLEEIKQKEKPVDFGDDIDHGDEDSDQTEEVGNLLAVANDLKARLDDIEVALEKIREGKYGVCEKCGEPIEEEILDIDPESRLCKRDKLAA